MVTFQGVLLDSDNLYPLLCRHVPVAQSCEHSESTGSNDADNMPNHLVLPGNRIRAVRCDVTTAIKSFIALATLGTFVRIAGVYGAVKPNCRGYC